MEQTPTLPSLRARSAANESSFDDPNASRVHNSPSRTAPGDTSASELPSFLLRTSALRVVEPSSPPTQTSCTST